MASASSRVILVAGTAGVGKSSLIQRFAQGTFAEDVAPTIGLDTSATAELTQDSCPPGLAALVPPEGITLELFEAGGREVYRAAPRGQRIDGLLICYDVGDRTSFNRASHLLLQHRMDRHLWSEASAVIASQDPTARLATVLCGTKTDLGSRSVSQAEADNFAEANRVAHCLASASTGEGAQSAFHALVRQIFEAEEEAAALVEAGLAELPAKERWSLAGKGPLFDSPAEMTSPPGERPHEPRGGAPNRLVEVYDAHGIVYGARPLQVCLEKGLFHRAVHVWFLDVKTGGMLMRRNDEASEKHQNLWGPSCHTEVECYEPDKAEKQGGHASELSTHAASRALKKQLGLEIAPDKPEHWFSCSSRGGGGTCCELIDVYVILLETPHLVLNLLPGEEVEWVHFTDVFGEEAAERGTVLFMEDEYKASMVHRIRHRIVYADSVGVFDDAVTKEATTHAASYPVVGSSRGSCPIRAMT